MQQFGVIQWSGIKKMEVTVVVLRSSTACVAVVSVSVSTNLISQAAWKSGRWKTREGRRQKRDLTYLSFFFLSRFQKETGKTATKASSLIVESLSN